MAIKKEIPAIKVHQWLELWDTVKFDKSDNRQKPNVSFLLFSIKAGVLKKLSKVYPRRAGENRDIDLGIQRKHDPDRSEEISKYVKYGYPLSDLVKGNKVPKELEDLQMPGWLPTAIVANILTGESSRGNKSIDKKDVIQVQEKNGAVTLILPSEVEKANWDPLVPPIEIIDGQHRLWAFNPEDTIADDFELPVVAFVNLDITWQAYLFYTINVKPKKINRSLAYDLYPLLRVQEWLERSPDTAQVYKETRAQEIVEILWFYKNSPWKDRINMLGDTQKSIEAGKTVPNITQASYIRNLIASFIKTTTTKGLGGLFGAKLTDDLKSPLNWNRTQQTAFIIFVWQKMFLSVTNCKLIWATSLRLVTDKNPMPSQRNGYDDLAFTSRYSLLTSDQGVRGFLHVINDMIFIASSKIKIREIKWSVDSEEINEDRINEIDLDKIVKDFGKAKLLNDYVHDICDVLVSFDWRTSSEPSLTNNQRQLQMVFKGSSGYRELRNKLLILLSHTKSNALITETAAQIMKELGYANN